MSLIRSLYKTRNLAKNGIFIVISGIGLLMLGYFIPDLKSRNIKQQIYTLNGFNTKHNDQTEVSDFYQSIKKNNGFLVLGTSETGWINGGNYYDFLNSDKDIESGKFSILAGAGRTCGIHIPLLLHHRNELDSLKIIYFINPVYWRTNLSDVSIEYWSRYNNYKMCNDINLSSDERDDYFKPVIAYNNKLNWIKKVEFYIEQILRSTRRNYFNKLRYNLYPEEYASQFSFISKTQFDYTKNSSYGKANFEKIDTVWNISKTFTQKEWFKPINKNSNYRNEEITSFLKLCKNLGIQATFIVGPYNERFIKEHDFNSIDDYKNVTQNIKQLLTENDADFIDATDISPVVGAFIDHQHHSAYGAYLIYLKIKHHLYEKENS